MNHDETINRREWLLREKGYFLGSWLIGKVLIYWFPFDEIASLIDGDVYDTEVHNGNWTVAGDTRHFLKHSWVSLLKNSSNCNSIGLLSLFAVELFFSR